MPIILKPAEQFKAYEFINFLSEKPKKKKQSSKKGKGNGYAIKKRKK